MKRVLALALILLLAFVHARELIVEGDYVKIKREGGYVQSDGYYDIVTEKDVRIFNENDLTNPVFVFDTILKRLGIGIANPLYALHVVGDMFTTGKVFASSLCLGEECISSWEEIMSSGEYNVNPGGRSEMNVIVAKEIQAGEISTSGLCLNGDCLSSWGELKEVDRITDEDNENYFLDPSEESVLNEVNASTVRVENLYITNLFTVPFSQCGKLFVENGEVKCGSDVQGVASCSQCDARFVNEGQSAGGDLSGNYPNPRVRAIQGRPVSSEAPESGEVLKWNGSQWTPGRVNCTVSSQCVNVNVSGGSATCPAGYIMVGINVRSTPYCVKTYMSSCGNYMGYFCGMNSVTGVRCCRLVCN